MVKFKFEKLIIWQKAMDFGEQINSMAYNFPEEEKFNLSSQICRAVDSISLNISEGSIGPSEREFNRFMGYSVRSLAEVVTCLHKASRREYVNKDTFNDLYQKSYSLMNSLIAFRNKLRI